MVTNKLHVGFVGTGILGEPMAQRLLSQGFELTVWNRTPSKLHGLEQQGARVAASPAALAAAVDVICLCLLDTGAVEQVVFGADGLVEAGGSRLLIDFSSITPEATRTLAARWQLATGAGWVDAPVSGGVPAAKAGTLIILAGGAAADVAQAQPVFDALAQRVTHLGPSGSGQMAKSCNQMIVGCNVLMIAEMLAAARRAGVEVEKLPGALAGGFADSLPLQLLGPRMAAGEFTPPLGSARAMLKDLDHAAALARASGSAAPLTALSAELYRSLGKRAELGGLDADICTLIKIFE